jgi:hypothetical protein
LRCRCRGGDLSRGGDECELGSPARIAIGRFERVQFSAVVSERSLDPPSVQCVPARNPVAMESGKDHGCAELLRGINQAASVGVIWEYAH